MYSWNKTVGIRHTHTHTHARRDTHTHTRSPFRIPRAATPLNTRIPQFKIYPRYTALYTCSSETNLSLYFQLSIFLDPPSTVDTLNENQLGISEQGSHQPLLPTRRIIDQCICKLAVRDNYLWE